MEPARQENVKEAGAKKVRVKKKRPRPKIEVSIAEMDALVQKARRLVENTNTIFEEIGLTREQLKERLDKRGITALGAQLRKEAARARAAKRRKKKKSAAPMRTRVKL